MQLFRGVQADITGLSQVLDERVLADASGNQISLIGTRSALALRREDTWQVWPWETIAGGSWDGERGIFCWHDFDGHTCEVELTRPGVLPELFRERIQASTVVETVVETDPGTVHIVGRRSLEGHQRLRWYAIGTGGADPNDSRIRALVLAETRRLEDDFL